MQSDSSKDDLFDVRNTTVCITKTYVGHNVRKKETNLEFVQVCNCVSSVSSVYAINFIITIARKDILFQFCANCTTDPKNKLKK